MLDPVVRLDGLITSNRQVVALAGDGGVSMLRGELPSIRQNNLPVKIVVFNNSSLNFVQLEMKAAGTVNFGTDLAETDFAAIAQASGIAGHRVERRASSLTRSSVLSTSPGRPSSMLSWHVRNSASRRPSLLPRRRVSLCTRCGRCFQAAATSFSISLIQTSGGACFTSGVAAQMQPSTQTPGRLETRAGRPCTRQLSLHELTETAIRWRKTE